MKSKSGLIVVILLVILIVFCKITNMEEEYRYLHDISSIKSIEIVKVEPITIEQDEPDQEILYTVNDINQFLEEFSQIYCTSMSPPDKIRYDSPVIKITYQNGDYELIDAYGQSEFINGVYFVYEGIYYFDKEQFADFINQFVDG